MQLQFKEADLRIQIGKIGYHMSEELLMDAIRYLIKKSGYNYDQIMFKENMEKECGCLTVEDFKKAQNALRKAHVPGPYKAIMAPEMTAADVAMAQRRAWQDYQRAEEKLMYSLAIKASCVGTEYHEDDLFDINQNQEKENTMTLDLQQASYFIDRLRTLRAEKLNDAAKKFGLENDESPRTVAELIARIVGGKYIVNDETKDVEHYSKGDLIRSITWRDPAIKKDQTGYDAAKKLIMDTYYTAKDAIMGNPAKGADAVTAYAAA